MPESWPATHHEFINHKPASTSQAEPASSLTYLDVHLRYTIPVFTILYLLARPLLHKNEKITLVFLLTCALFYTTPWDNYIISKGAWSYPSGRATDSPLGHIPLEEYFFFIIQTGISGLFVQLVTRWDLHVLHLRETRTFSPSLIQNAPLAIMAGIVAWGWSIGNPGTPTFYLGSILWWVTPIIGLQWWIASSYIVKNWKKAVIAILLPSSYLCLVDHIALKEGVWIIQPNTSTGIMITNSLPLEEALFFFLTNVMIVLGTFAAQRTYAVECLQSQQAILSKSPPQSYFLSLVKAVLTPDSALPQSQIQDLQTALGLLSRGSLSFAVAARLFPQSIREQITALYSFCRISDDIADEAALSPQQRIKALNLLRTFADSAYNGRIEWDEYEKEFDSKQNAALRVFSRYIPHVVPKHAVYELLDGYAWDLDSEKTVRTQQDLVNYCAMVASSVGEACCSIMITAETPDWNPSSKEGRETIKRARDMGVALQMVNMARDVSTDAVEIGRLYAPDGWIEDIVRSKGASSEVVTQQMVDEERKLITSDPWADEKVLRNLAEKFLESAEPYADSADIGLKLLPNVARRPCEAALRIYMGIGDIIRSSEKYPERAATSKWLKLGILIRTMYFS